MKPEPVLADLLFEVDVAPVEAVCARDGAVLRRPVPGRKALIHRPTGRVLGVVGDGYRIVTNREALELARKVCARAFPGVSAAEWEPARVSAPLTLGHAVIDLQHRTHVLNLTGMGGAGADPYTPFVSVTNSFNGTRALRFDFGFVRRHCANGVIFERDLARLMAPHRRAALNEFEVKVRTISIEDKWREFSAMINALRAAAVAAPTARQLVATLLTLPPMTRCRTERQQADRRAWTLEIGQRHARYETELGANAYAVFNTVTDFAARPPEIVNFARPRPTLEQRAGAWLRTVKADAAKSNPIDWAAHQAALRKTLGQSN